MRDAVPASVQQSERCSPLSLREFLHAGQQTAPAACSSSHYTQYDRVSFNIYKWFWSKLIGRAEVDQGCIDVMETMYMLFLLMLWTAV